MNQPADRRPFAKLLDITRQFDFRDHRIAHQLDAKGRHELELPPGFPFIVSLFHFRAGEITHRLTWHQRLELLLPLDGPLSERMGDCVEELLPGDILVVDHLQPHQVVDRPGLDTRAVVISFLPECVFTPGSPPADSAFLIPFHRGPEGRPHVLRAASPLAGLAHEATANLVASFFNHRDFHREAGCKAWLLVLLHGLIQEFRGAAPARQGLLRRQQWAVRLKPVFDHVRNHYADRLSVAEAAAMCGMSSSVFGRVFKQVGGMTLVTYLHHVRMAHAVELLEQTADPIAEIASRLGFSDQSHFNRRFRKTFGRTPSQHRVGPSHGRR